MSSVAADNLRLVIYRPKSVPVCCLKILERYFGAMTIALLTARAVSSESLKLSLIYCIAAFTCIAEFESLASGTHRCARMSSIIL